MRHQSAFTLVELSIVLIIVGLLVGGVLTGQALIRAAELRAITTEKDKYITTLYAFRDKYQALPAICPTPTPIGVPPAAPTRPMQVPAAMGTGMV